MDHMEGMRRSRTRFLQKHVLFLIIMSLLPVDLAPFDSCSGRSRGMVVQPQIDINVGVVIDLGSWTGKNVHDCITMAISDYYASTHHRKTRLILHTRDSSGPADVIFSALDLLEKTKVQALVIGPGNNNLETKSLGALANKAKVAIFSFSSTLSSPVEHPFLLHINQDQTLQFEAIASILGLYQWKTASLIFEDCDDGRDSIPYLVRSLQERDARVTHRTPISSLSTDDQILDELHKLAMSQQTVFIVHLSPSNAYRVFSTAKKLGMMEEGYAWIVTDSTMNQLQSMDEEMFRAMQGVVGLKSYIPSSRKLQDFRLRWKKEFYSRNPSVESRDLDVLSIWAYDAMWALAESIEKLGHKYHTNSDEMAGGNFCRGYELVYGIARTRFVGLSGDFQIVGGRILSEAFEVVNVIGKEERRVGLWSLEHGIVKGRSLSVSGDSSPKNKMVGLDEPIIWPGVTKVAPKGRLMLTAGKKLRIAALHNDGFGQFTSVKRNIEANTTSVTGFCVDVFHAALKLLDYEVDFEFIPYVDQDGKNLGSYSDLVYQVYLQNYDGIVGDISITVNRSLYVDFTATYSDVGIGTIMKRDNSDIWLFSRPLQPKLWLTLSAFLVITGLVVWAIERSSGNTEFEGSVVHQIGTALWFGCSTLFYAHREGLKSNWSRLVVIVWLFSVFILQSSYTATLSSMLTLQQIQQGSAGGLIGTHFNSFIGGAIVNSLNPKDNRLMLFNSCKEYADALSRGIKKGGVGAIVDEIPYLKAFLAKYGADYAMVASHSTTNGLGFAFQKKYADLVSDLSRAIIKLREEGELAAMEDLWIKSGEQSLLPKTDFTAPGILNPETFGGLFLVSSCCCISALLFHFGLIFLQKKLENLGFYTFILAHMLNTINHTATATGSSNAANGPNP